MDAKSGLLILLLCVPAAGIACGEGMFNAGKGLPYQAYLAPRPAAVLVYADGSGADARREELYAGLQKAGHSITVVRDAQALREAMRERRYDVVISAFDRIGTVVDVESAQAPALLPVVARAVRNSPEVRNRFDLFLVDGASLGQYLRAINRLVDGRS